MRRIPYIICAILAVASCTSGKDVSWQDKSLPAEVRAADLLSKLSFEEKASLMRYDSPGIDRLGIPPYNWWNEALHGVARNGSAPVLKAHACAKHLAVHSGLEANRHRFNAEVSERDLRAHVHLEPVLRLRPVEG